MVKVKKQTSSDQQKSSYDPKLDQLARICTNRIEDLLLNLDVDLTQSGNKYVGNCPIHGNSNSGSFNLYHDGYAVPGYWKCRSKSCESVFRPTIIGFTRGRLSHLELGYEWGDQAKPDKIFSFKKTLDYLCNFAKVNLNNIQIDPRAEERRKFLLECKSLVEAEEQSFTVHRSVVQKNMIFPAEYFVKRGFTEEVLRTFDVGMSKKPKKVTENRVIVPIYNENEYLIGYTARSIFEKCKSCQLFHNPTEGCPMGEADKTLYSKWHNDGFKPESTLYNYWMAKPVIDKTKVVVLVEGPGDVWKLTQNGIKNVVGMFGNTLRNKQERLLAKLQTMVLICMNDSDSAGLEGARLIKKNFGRLYRLHFPLYDGKDVGDLNDDVITDRIKPMIEEIMRAYANEI